MKWVFLAMALNKEVSADVDIPVKFREKVNAETGDLHMRILTKSCKSQTHDAYKHGGPTTLGAAFQMRGQIAAQGIFSASEVPAGGLDLDKYLGQEKLARS